MKEVACVLLLAASAFGVPVSQPVYPTAQYLGAQQAQPLQLAAAQQPQIQYIQPQYVAAPQAQLYQPTRQRNPPPPPPPPQHPPAGITQILIPSSADRQVQKAAANIAGPEFAQQVQVLQLQGLANQAQAVAQRRAQVAAQRQALNYRQVQPQYLQEIAQAQATKPNLQLLSQDGGVPNAQDNQPQEDYDPNPSYQFGFDVKDDYYTNYQNRKEQRDGNKISGSYSVVDSDGFLRTVTYTADPKEGFKAEVNRQPTDIVVKIPKPVAPQFKQQQYLQEAPDGRQVQQPKQRIIYQYQ